jgi:hypothetical protein
MRIAVSGTHFSGKSSLIASLLKHFPNYSSVEEPYFLLEEEGYTFSDPPSVEDFEKQFDRSLRTLRESTDDTLFDRCPFDLLAYAEVLTEASAIEESLPIEYWIQEMEDAIDRLDLIIFIPIEKKDRILVPKSEDQVLRKAVDQKLRELLLDDSLGILQNIEVLEVIGSLEKRVQTIKEYLSERKK